MHYEGVNRSLLSAAFDVEVPANSATGHTSGSSSALLDGASERQKHTVVRYPQITSTAKTPDCFKKTFSFHRLTCAKHIEGVRAGPASCVLLMTVRWTWQIC
ncbi:hypothetical protein TGCAST_357430 [Toxoplasma gondii CAST]|uniref:Uncharacterized protein n=1 Tax=Toxoplasma gondii CAST TaxID=943122 RepID=A0A425I339_TOXGO|nr:hypothetical protein TGCAST_357430 [Toxoplasma gondii CAST]